MSEMNSTHAFVEHPRAQRATEAYRAQTNTAFPSITAELRRLTEFQRGLVVGHIEYYRQEIASLKERIENKTDQLNDEIAHCLKAIKEREDKLLEIDRKLEAPSA